MKKLAILGVATFGLLFGTQGLTTHAEERTVTSKQELKKEQIKNHDESKVKNGDKINSHIGEKPLFTQKDSKTGVVVNAYPSKEVVTPSFADTPGWDYRGEEYWYMLGVPNEPQWDSTYISTGGSYCVTVPGHVATYVAPGYAKAALVELWENDYGWSSDDYVTEFAVRPASYPIDYVVDGIDAYTDGSEGWAELYTYHYSNYAVSGGKIYGVSYWD